MAAIKADQLLGIPIKMSLKTYDKTPVMFSSVTAKQRNYSLRHKDFGTGKSHVE
jgi:hypothetical protein